MIFGTSALSKESRERTADFLLVKPVSRAAVVTAKLLASLTMILVIDVVFYAGLSIMAHIVATKSYDEKTFFLINLTLLFIQLIFFALGMAASVFFSKLKSVLPLSLGVVLGFYLIGALITGSGTDDAFRYVSPFNYFNTVYIIEHANYELSYLITSAIVVAAAIIVSYVMYIRKDIRAVN
ncbi:ABC transporter permease subunit [Terrilactibacillus sp. S3-3]|nr:ABC transporter permease subunit [Terrilactibacillus sp. S3-3]